MRYPMNTKNTLNTPSTQAVSYSNSCRVDFDIIKHNIASIITNVTTGAVIRKIAVLSSKILLAILLFAGFTIPSYAKPHESKILFLYSNGVLAKEGNNVDRIVRKSQEWLDKTNAIYRRQNIPIRLIIATKNNGGTTKQGVLKININDSRVVNGEFAFNENANHASYSDSALLAHLSSDEFDFYIKHPTGGDVDIVVRLVGRTCRGSILGVRYSYTCYNLETRFGAVATGSKSININKENISLNIEPMATETRSVRSSQKELSDLLPGDKSIGQLRREYGADFVVVLRDFSDISEYSGLGIIRPSPGASAELVNSICNNLPSIAHVNCGWKFKQAVLKVVDSMGGRSLNQYFGSWYDNVRGDLMKVGDRSTGYSKGYTRTARNIRIKSIVTDLFNRAMPYYSAYSIIGYNKKSPSLLAHELGHNMGLSHSHRQTRESVTSEDRTNNKAGLTDYAYGYGVPGDFHTLMAYQDAFSNSSPTIFSDGFESSAFNSPSNWDWWTTDGSSPINQEYAVEWHDSYESFMPSLGPFIVSKNAANAYSGIALADRQCKLDYGDTFRLTDWADLTNWFEGGTARDSIFNNFIRHIELAGMYSGSLISYRGREVHGGTRHYYLHVSTGTNGWHPEAGIHGSNLKVGSWPLRMHALCYNENYYHFDGYHNDDSPQTNVQKFRDYHYPTLLGSKYLFVGKKPISRDDDYDIRILSKGAFDIRNKELSFYAKLPGNRIKSMYIGWINSNAPLSYSANSLPTIAFYTGQEEYPANVLRTSVYYGSGARFSRLAERSRYEGAGWHYYQIKVYDNKAFFYMDHELLATHNINQSDLSGTKKIAILAHTSHLRIDGIMLRSLSGQDSGEVDSLHVFSDPTRYCRGNIDRFLPCGSERTGITAGLGHRDEAPADAARLLREKAAEYSRNR